MEVVTCSGAFLFLTWCAEGVDETFIPPLIAPNVPARVYFRFGKPVQLTREMKDDREAADKEYAGVKASWRTLPATSRLELLCSYHWQWMDAGRCWCCMQFTECWCCKEEGGRMVQYTFWPKEMGYSMAHAALCMQCRLLWMTTSHGCCESESKTLTG